ncbi:hypothetical protein M6B38_172955 [Iris pallida]|uniref:Uncharacterized protein n=1 Tax=Iris pallida TaxID=29817 RepID=A0AAX6ETY5_IRIPA|nr:hypothetical protein M6B38_106240 [Iris pallida]KAJ6807398.1 hypothetical protein M6B38_172955 [Iris pallida]
MAVEFMANVLPSTGDSMTSPLINDLTCSFGRRWQDWCRYFFLLRWRLKVAWRCTTAC